MHYRFNVSIQHTVYINRDLKKFLDTEDTIKNVIALYNIITKCQTESKTESKFLKNVLKRFHAW